MSCTFSIVVANFNHAATLPKAVDSAFAELGDGGEVVVVDDGSNDDSLKVLGTLKEKWSDRLRVIAQANGGPGAARNRGAREAKGEYIVFLDADDVFLEGAFKRFREALARQPQAAMIYGGRMEAFPGGRVRTIRPKPLAAERRRNFADYLLHRRPSIGIGAAAIRRDVALETQFPEDLRVAEDDFFYAQVLARHACASFAEPVFVYNIEPARHAQRLEAVGFDLVAWVERLFQLGKLPEDVRSLEKRCVGAACLSQFRALHRAGRDRAARPYYYRAMARVPFLAFQWRYLRKYLRGLFGIKHPELRAA